MEQQRAKAVRIDIGFEVTHQIAITIILVLFSTSQTRTTSGMEALFLPNGSTFLGIEGIYIFTGSMVLSFISFMNLATYNNKKAWKSMLTAGSHAVLSLVMRILSMVVMFMPSLGLMDSLRHFQADSIPFKNPRTGTFGEGLYKYNFAEDLLYFGNAPPVAWSDISHVDYSDPLDPKPPHYSIYTGMSSKQTFVFFSVLWTLQILSIWIKNYCMSPSFRKMSALDQYIHSFLSVIMPIPSVDWSIGDGDIADHYQRQVIIHNSRGEQLL